jgi:hypothetical protein
MPCPGAGDGLVLAFDDRVFSRWLVTILIPPRAAPAVIPVRMRPMVRECGLVWLGWVELVLAGLAWLGLGLSYGCSESEMLERCVLYLWRSLVGAELRVGDGNQNRPIHIHFYTLSPQPISSPRTTPMRLTRTAPTRLLNPQPAAINLGPSGGFGWPDPAGSSQKSQVGNYNDV